MTWLCNHLLAEIEDRKQYCIICGEVFQPLDDARKEILTKLEVCREEHVIVSALSVGSCG